MTAAKGQRRAWSGDPRKLSGQDVGPLFLITGILPPIGQRPFALASCLWTMDGSSCWYHVPVSAVEGSSVVVDNWPDDASGLATMDVIGKAVQEADAEYLAEKAASEQPEGG